MNNGIHPPGRTVPPGGDVSARGIRWLLFARLAVAVSILGFFLVSTRGWGETPSSKVIYAVVTGVLALNAAYMVLLRRVRDLDTFARVQIGIDIALEALLVSLTGGAESQIVVFFLLSVMSASLLLSWRAAAAFTAEAAVLHVLVTLLGLAGLPSHTTADARTVVSSLFVQLLAFSAVAVLSGLLAHRLALARLLSRDILGAIGQGLVVADSRDRILFSNDEARDLLGAEAVSPGRTLDEAFPLAVRESLGADYPPGEPGLREAELERPGGEKIPVSIKVRPVVAESGRAAGTLVVLTDRSLEHRVEEAMMAAQRSEAVSQMATAIAHEIRNPLASMRASVQEIARVLEESRAGAGGDSQALLDIVLSESDRLDAIISEFLAFAKMRPVRKVLCDMSQVVRDASLLLRQSAEQGQEVEIRPDCDGSLQCRVDPHQLRQVLLNLGLNCLEAVRDVPDPTVSLRVRPCAYLDFPLGSTEGKDPVFRTPGEREGVQIDVEDNGCGMTAEVRARAMDPFFTQKERGTGLGLAVVERIVKAHRGTVHIESAPGRGTAVRIWLPVED